METIAPTWLQAAIFVIFLDLIPKTGQPNHGRDEPPAHPIDSFVVRGSKIAIGRWGPSPLPGSTFEHPSVPSLCYVAPLPIRKTQFISTLIPNFLFSVQQ